MREKTIFCVDDDPRMCALLGTLLKGCLPEISQKEFGDPRELLEAVLDGEAVDLIITDGEMPQMTGAQLAAEISRAGYNIPVIMLTGNSRLRLPLEGVAAIHYKPISMDPFIKMIKQYLETPVQ